jgi:hypothetical protein
MEKLQGIGEFVAGIAVAGLTGTILLWGTVSANRADIENIKGDLTYVRERIDTIYGNPLEAQSDE